MMPETRPRIVYNDQGVCNACLWAEEKKTEVDWKARWCELEELCDKYRSRNTYKFDCILPVSGGKDSSYVAYMMKEKMGMHPLCVTLKPPLEIDVGVRNLQNFINCGYDHIHITPNPQVARKIAKEAFISQGQPLHAWIISVQTAIFRSAVLLDIPFVMFGEEGETEYGGTTKLKEEACYGLEDSINIYLSGLDPRKYTSWFSEKELYWWLYPSMDEFRRLNPSIAHWSYFENWESYKHYLLAKEKLGLEETPQRCIGTYNNFAQTDTTLYDLHCYLMYLKFGFGRCSQDVGIDIRRGAMMRRQALTLVKKYDGEYPQSYIKDYLTYFDMTMKEFDAVLDHYADKNLFKKINGKWAPTFTPH